jgi:phosphate transport system permease protein
MTISALILLIFGVGLIGWATARAKASRFERKDARARAHSLPGYHGAFVFLCAVAPAYRRN